MLTRKPRVGELVLYCPIDKNGNQIGKSTLHTVMGFNDRFPNLMMMGNDTIIWRHKDKELNPFLTIVDPVGAGDCHGRDPLCPCQDGDPCHYLGENSMSVVHSS